MEIITLPEQDLSTPKITRAATIALTLLIILTSPLASQETQISDPDPKATKYVQRMLVKISRGELVLEDFAFVRQTIFPRMRSALTNQLQGLGAPDRMELLDRQLVGDDISLQYWAWYGDKRFRVLVSLGPNEGLTALRLISEGVQ